jgi:hypothetical protein
MTRFRMNVGTAVVVASLLGTGTASATLVIQKKAKEAGFAATNCLYCHEDKLPKKEKHASNDRGKFLTAEKEKLKADEIDVTWLKNYKEAAKP